VADPDLAALWDAHCRSEFETRDVDATMATMVDEPYVNPIPRQSQRSCSEISMKLPHRIHWPSSTVPNMGKLSLTRVCSFDPFNGRGCSLRRA
jgi:hypothetical protein